MCVCVPRACRSTPPARLSFQPPGLARKLTPLPPPPPLLSFSLLHPGIRLAGATSDVHIFEVRPGKWTKVTPQGEPPSPRAAHAAAAVGNMVVIQV